MAKLFLPSVAVLALGALLVSICTAYPSGPIGLIADYGSLPGLLRRLDAEENLDAHLDETRAMILRRVEAREEITNELLDGKVSLGQAAARFQALDIASPDHGKHVQRAIPGASPEERVCRHVIVWAYSALVVESPDRAERLRERLERELRALLDRQGGIRLE